MKHSVVIRSYNEERHIGRLLAGLMQQNVSDLEIVLVDSGSTDATLDIASRFPVKLVELSKEQFSFGRSLNLGFESSSGSIVVCASAHVYPTRRDWIERLVAPLSDDQVALTYGRQRGDERSNFSEQQLFRAWFPEQTARATDYPFCNNANSAVRRSEWVKHPFDEDLTGLEDLEWAKRAVSRGLGIMYVPGADVVHVHEETPLRIFRRYQREAIALREIYPEQHFYLTDLLRLLPSHVGRDLLLALKTRATLPVISEIMVFRTMQFMGTFAGFHRRTKRSDELKETFYYPARETGAETERCQLPDEMVIAYGQLDPGKGRANER